MKTSVFQKIDPFKIKNKKDFFFKKIKNLTIFHYKKSKEYNKILKSLKFNPLNIKNLKDMPFLPVNLFKKNNLMSINKNDVAKTLFSSGTSGNSTSKIFLDKENTKNQIIVLKKIMTNFLGSERLPMLIVDNDPSENDRKKFDARSAAIHGFSIFGRNHTFIVNKLGKLDYVKINNFLKKYGNKKFLIFGFTSFIYSNLIINLDNKKVHKNFENGVLLHGGGWKKLKDIKISNDLFKKKLFKKLKIKKIHNYYGLVEQTGSIFIECEKCGSFLTSNFSDVFIRDKFFNLVKDGTSGIVQLFSFLPTSYPGHNILTEDYGEIVPKNKTKCKKNVKHFVIHGRLKQSEIRGCSDV